MAGLIRIDNDWWDTFVIDENNSDQEYLYVDIPGKGTVVIKSQDNGIVVDIFPLQVSDAPVASTWADMSDLWFPEEKR